MVRNDNGEFVGLARIKERQAAQLEEFEAWAAKRDWNAFHEHHYDWWMFPIDAPSSYGFAWTVFDGEIADLKEDPQFISRFLRGVYLLARSWGWDIDKRDYIPDPDPGQAWANWPIRLYKMAKSVKLFGFTEVFDSLRQYALDLAHRGMSFDYSGRNLIDYFMIKE
jgi:hypothetical protein